MGTHPIFESDFDCLTEMSQTHTILLIQPSPKLESRTYSDFECLSDCMEGVCRIYEEHLKKSNPSSNQITYDISQLFDFIDDLQDLACFVFKGASKAYQPYSREW